MGLFGGLFGDSRLKTVEKRLKTLHFKQSKLREKILEAETEAKKGDAKAKEHLKSLHADREKVNAEVAELVAEQKKLKSA